MATRRSRSAPSSSSLPRSIGIVLAVFAALYLVGLTGRIVARKYYLFLPGYVRWQLSARERQSDGPTHLLVLVADHFEPGRDEAGVRRWLGRYRTLAARHRDSSGQPPQHTWFYAIEQSRPAILRMLGEAVADGLGEVEVHYHHGWDSSETFTQELGAMLVDFQAAGFAKTIDGETKFAFVHGNWSLDNSDGITLCGVNNELEALRRLGAFADFTFPALWDGAQPPIVNAIYAAKDDDQPKSYRHPLPITALRDGRADLMIFQGPLVLFPSKSVTRLFWDIEYGNLHEANVASPARVERWVQANVHVPGQPAWVFIKLFSHGISSAGDEESNVGASFDKALTHLEQRYNDGQRYVLHYVTAREAYNVARAAAEGATGNPRDFVDRYVAPYVAGSASRAARSGRAPHP